MIEESYVSFDTAKMLKEAEFREPTKTHYSNSGQVWETITPADCNNDFNCNRPTQALVARWLREVHGIHVSANIFTESANDVDDNTVNERNFWSYDLFHNSGRIIELSNDKYDSFEEAIEAGLKYSLELIKKKRL